MQFGIAAASNESSSRASNRIESIILRFISTDSLDLNFIRSHKDIDTSRVCLRRRKAQSEAGKTVRPRVIVSNISRIWSITEVRDTANASGYSSGKTHHYRTCATGNVRFPVTSIAALPHPPYSLFLIHRYNSRRNRRGRTRDARELGACMTRRMHAASVNMNSFLVSRRRFRVYLSSLRFSSCAARRKPPERARGRARTHASAIISTPVSGVTYAHEDEGRGAASVSRSHCVKHQQLPE